MERLIDSLQQINAVLNLKQEARENPKINSPQVQSMTQHVEYLERELATGRRDFV